MRISIKGEMKNGELLVSIQRALAVIEAAGMTRCKGIAIYFTPIDATGATVNLYDPDTGAKIDPVRGFTLPPYTGPTADDADTYRPPQK